MATLTLRREFWQNTTQALEREWLLTNGIGGYAMSTLVGANTRRYHGLLVAALEPPLGRYQLMAKVGEELSFGGLTYFLSTNEYQNATIQPRGYVHLAEARFEDGLPTFRFEADTAVLEKTIWMEYGHNTTYLRYTLGPDSPPCALQVLPLVNYRDHHAETTGSADWRFQIDRRPGGCQVLAYEGAAPFYLLSDPPARFNIGGDWYWRFVHRRERERGLDSQEDLYLSGSFSVRLRPGESFTFICSTEPLYEQQVDAAEALERERTRRRKLLERAEERQGHSLDEFASHLVLAADPFIVRRTVHDANGPRRGRTVIAGYPWFGDWGRDTFISLAGLCLPTGKHRTACTILRTYAQYFSDGMLPNRFPDEGETPDYNTVDATLWYFEALRRYLDASGDEELLPELFPALAECISWHVKGTRYGIGVDPADGLLRAGEEGVQLTWMDAKVNNWVVTPRAGKPVEVNALWHNALRLMARWAEELAAPGEQYAALADKAAASFAARFWYAGGGYLYDVVDGPQGDDASLRPNQALAVSLPGALLPPEQQRAVVDVLAARLVTPRGLRSLDAADPRYVGRYEGGWSERDGAYHQGTVWAWLIGPFVEAHLRIYGDKAQARAYLEPFREALTEAGVGSISEIYDGDPPHRPRGCPAQAWSVAEVLRMWERVRE